MRWVLMTPFRRPGRAGGEQELGDRVRPDLRLRGVDLRAGGLRQKRIEQGGGARRGRVGARDDFDVLRHGRFDRGGERRAVSDENKTRRQDRDDRLELDEILGDERIGRRDGSVRNAGDHGAETDERVIDAVSGQDRDRPLGAKAAVDQASRDAARRLARLGVSEFAPVLA